MLYIPTFLFFAGFIFKQSGTPTKGNERQYIAGPKGSAIYGPPCGPFGATTLRAYIAADNICPKGPRFFVVAPLGHSFLVTPEGPKGARRGGIYC